MGPGVSAPLNAALPIRDGVGASCVSLPEGSWATITDFLVQRFPAQPRTVWLQRMHSGEVVDETGAAVSPTQPYRSRLRVYYYRTLETEARIPFDEVLLFQDAHMLVVDKPHFLPVVPSGRYLQETLLVRLKRKLGLEALVPIHRIDRDTAGLVMFSVQPATRDHYHALFRNRLVDKTYEAIAPWRDDLQFPLTRSSRIGPSAHFMQQQELPGTPNTTTHIALLARHGERAHYQLRPVTGHRHQLRVHMAALGIPIIGDGIYPVLTPEGAPDYQRPLQLLAKSLQFTDPLCGEVRRFDSLRMLSLLDSDQSR